jgi:hypothetical protein
MRKVTYGAACSLDGYLARTDDRVDWLHWSEDVDRITGEYWPGVDAVLRFEAVLAQGDADYGGPL